VKPVVVDIRDPKVVNRLLNRPLMSRKEKAVVKVVGIGGALGLLSGGVIGRNLYHNKQTERI
jgi:hypothetical protein